MRINTKFYFYFCIFLFTQLNIWAADPDPTPTPTPQPTPPPPCIWYLDVRLVGGCVWSDAEYCHVMSYPNTCRIEFCNGCNDPRCEEFDYIPFYQGSCMAENEQNCFCKALDYTGHEAYTFEGCGEMSTNCF